jgi:hypothetical protein
MHSATPGGGFDHGQHLAYDKKNNKPLCNLYVALLQQMGVEGDRFGTSSGTLDGFRPKRSNR